MVVPSVHSRRYGLPVHDLASDLENVSYQYRYGTRVSTEPTERQLVEMLHRYTYHMVHVYHGTTRVPWYHLVPWYSEYLWYSSIYGTMVLFEIMLYLYLQYQVHLYQWCHWYVLHMYSI